MTELREGQALPVYCISAMSQDLGDEVEVTICVWRGAATNVLADPPIRMRMPSMRDTGVPMADQLRFAIRDALSVARSQIPR